MKMKAATYLTDSGPVTVTYDADAPCEICGEPVKDASMAGTVICAWCDVGRCRYCKAPLLVVRIKLDGGKSMGRWRQHMARHRQMQAQEHTNGVSEG